MPYTERSRANLLREGVPGERICVTGNPILEVIEHFRPQIDRSTALQSHGLTAQNFVLVTLHRAENVDVKHRLVNFTKALTLLSERHGWPVIVSTHPRTAAQMSKFGLGGARGGVRCTMPTRITCMAISVSLMAIPITWTAAPRTLCSTQARKACAGSSKSLVFPVYRFSCPRLGRTSSWRPANASWSRQRSSPPVDRASTNPSLRRPSPTMVPLQFLNRSLSARYRHQRHD